MEMRPFGRLLPYRTAVARLLRATRPVTGTEAVELELAVGRVPARDVRARADVPSFARASWDGYAFAARATRLATSIAPTRLRIVGEVFADTGYSGRLGLGETVAIATGGAMPAGSDTVIIFEETVVEDGRLLVPRPVPPGERVAEVGEDFRRGQVVAPKDRPLTPASVGAVAATGGTSVTVYRAPRVAIVPNGNELVAPGHRLGPGQIFESNNFVLAGLLRSVGVLPRVHSAVPDDAGAIEAALRAALAENDAVIVTGGSSVGEHDYLPAVFPRIGRLLFHGLAVRPGKPTLAAVAGGKLLVGMPGHPTSCLSNGFWLLLPMLRRLAHLPGPGTVEMPVRMEAPYEIARGSLATVVPLRIDHGRGRPTFKGSSAISSLTEANGYVIVPAGGSSLRKGQPVTAHLLPAPVGVPPLA